MIKFIYFEKVQVFKGDARNDLLVVDFGDFRAFYKP